MRILICDDNIETADYLKKFIISYFLRCNYSIPEIICYQNGKDLLNDQKKIDILFLDIELPDINGIELGNKIKALNPNTIILVITAYMDYLDDAMRFRVFRYIPKPFNKLKLSQNLTDALQHYNSLNSSVAIETKSHVYTVNTKDIIAVESTARKVTIYTTSCNYLSIHKIDYWENHLPSNTFVRTHRSYIVNLAHVTDFNKSCINVTGNKLKVYLTERKYTFFKKAYMLFIEMI